MKSEPPIAGREGRFAYSINEVCATTNLGRDAVYRAISAGQLVARKLGRRTLITDDDLRQFLAGCRAPAAAIGSLRRRRPPRSISHDCHHPVARGAPQTPADEVPPTEP